MLAVNPGEKIFLFLSFSFPPSLSTVSESSLFRLFSFVQIRIGIRVRIGAFIVRFGLDFVPKVFRSVADTGNQFPAQIWSADLEHLTKGNKFDHELKKKIKKKEYKTF